MKFKKIYILASVALGSATQHAISTEFDENGELSILTLRQVPPAFPAIRIGCSVRLKKN